MYYSGLTVLIAYVLIVDEKITYVLIIDEKYDFLLRNFSSLNCERCSNVLERL